VFAVSNAPRVSFHRDVTSLFLRSVSNDTQKWKLLGARYGQHVNGEVIASSLRERYWPYFGIHTSSAIFIKLVYGRGALGRYNEFEWFGKRLEIVSRIG
jgi:hypothetical protein